MKFSITKSISSKINSVDWKNLGFGKYLSDHVFIADYSNGSWQNARIEPYAPMPIEPAMVTLHYAQTIFEGLKAFRNVNGGINIFRPDKNAERMATSGKLICIPEIPKEIFVEGCKELAKIDHAWVPKEQGHSLYLRPLIYGSDNFLGVHASSSYRFIIMSSPVALYYSEGLNPVKIQVCTDRVRAVRGGLGSAKAGANYAASLYAGTRAKKDGYAQVLWLDGVTHEIVDEVGAMNIFFVINGKLITPTLDQETILAGVTRDSVIHIAKKMGWSLEERIIKMEEIVQAYKDGKLEEVFGTGTAAVISPVGQLHYGDLKMVVNNNKIGKISQKLYDTITGIQYGSIEDSFGWNVKIDA
jgi:branched-chain amino acid aminotransferase